MNKKIGIIIGLLVLVLVVVITVSLVSSNKQDTFKIGYAGPLTGAMGVSTGESIFQAFQLANEQHPTVNGKKVEVIYEDDVCDPKKAVNAVQKLIEVDKVDVIVSGLCSGSVLSTAPIVEKAKVVMVSPGAAAPSITNAGDYTFRLAASSVTAGKAVASLIEKYDYKRIGIIYENNEYPVGWKDAIVSAYENRSDVKIFTEGAPIASSDVRTQIMKIAAQKPDVILVATLTPGMANALLNQLHELKVNKPIIANEVFSLRSVIHNPFAENMLVTVYKYGNSSTDFQKFLADYKQKFNKDIQEDIYGAASYDTYTLLLKTKESCGNSGSDCIKNYLYDTKNWSGLSGTISIDQNGDSSREFVLKVVKGGKAVEIN
ncbi:MAG: ABC transporter substrate-binding protein [bacterium]